ncbi:MAG: hypothetical protein WA294_04185 [Acidobacteriaceae bacterium]
MPTLTRIARPLLAFALLLLAALLVIDTLHWPLVGDATLMHYGAFLLDHGFAPYRQIVDINMPGGILTDWTVIHIFGPGALAWRLFDFALIAAAAAAMLVIARPYGWLGGLFAAVFFFALHIHDGVDQAGERDLVLAVLLLLACAAIFAALRRSASDPTPSLAATWIGVALFGFLCGAATLIKPTAAAWMAGILVLAIIAMRSRKQHVAPFIAAACVAFCMPLALALLFLAREHSIHAFFATVTGLMVYHAGIDRFPLRFLLTHLVPSALYPVILLWIVLAIAHRHVRGFEGAALLFSVFIGIVSFVAQGKAFPYHRYPLEAFLFLLIGIDAATALQLDPPNAGESTAATRDAASNADSARRSMLWQPIAALAILLFPTFVLAPSWLLRAHRYDWRHDEFKQSLTADLTQLGGPQLSGQVQCLDMTAGCLGALYQLRLVQTTGFLYDCYFFHQPQNAVTLGLRDAFLADLRRNPPRLIVVSNQNCLGEPLAWPRSDAWPQFSDWLAAHYSMDIERQPQRMIRWWPVAEFPPAYRIYLRDRERQRPSAAAFSEP